MKDDGPSDAKGSLAAPTERPIELPKSLPSMQREKSKRVLGDKRAAARVRENYEFVKRLGSPGQSRRRVMKRRDTKQNVAVKRIGQGAVHDRQEARCKVPRRVPQGDPNNEAPRPPLLHSIYEAFEDSNYLYMRRWSCALEANYLDRIVEKTHNEAEAALPACSSGWPSPIYTDTGSSD